MGAFVTVFVESLGASAPADQVARRRWVDGTLARARGASAGALRIERTAGHKPRCEPPSELLWSASYARDVAGVAVSRAGPVGFDLAAAVDVGGDVLALARQMLAGDEARRVLEAADPIDAFLVEWTRKEAVLKALGLGLSVDPRTFTLRREGEAWRLLGLDGPREWTLAERAVRHGVRAAVACPAAAVEVCFA